MKLKLRWTCLLLVINAAVWCTSASAFQRPAPNAPLDNAAVVKLVRAGFRDKAVISIIGSRDVHFDLSTDQLIALKKHGVSEKVILAMIGRAQGDIISADDIAMDDSMDFPPLTSQGQGSGQGQPSNGDSTNIFGSSGGSRGRSKSNTGSGGIENDTVTTGSATVRIVRPPSESGGASSPKLERTPTLTNDSIADLVQAGFSEGTIIRRIQNSPVDFDLSAKKIDNLHQRHVTDPIIDAMRAAMADDGSSPTGQVNPKR
jgi:hypothetical protein